MTRNHLKPKKEDQCKPIEFFTNKILCGDAFKVLQKLPSESVDCVVTSPPYWALRDYGAPGQIGLEPSIEEYLEKLLTVFDEIRRILKPTGTCWINFGDTYANKTTRGQQNNRQNTMVSLLNSQPSFSRHTTEFRIPPKSLCLIPLRFAVRMIERSWIMRNEIIWHKPNAMPQSVRDRFTVDFEKIFFFVKARRYYFNQQYEPLKNSGRLERRLLDPNKIHKYTKSYWFSARPEVSEKQRLKMLQKGRNKRCVWTIGTAGFKGDNFAVYPEKLIETPIKAGCPLGGIVLDPFVGSGTTAIVAKKLERNYIGIDISRKNVALAQKRLRSL